MTVGAAPAVAGTAACTGAWSIEPTPSPGEIYSVLLDVAAVSSTDAWAVGFRAYFDQNEQYAVSPIVEHWNGSAWSLTNRPSEQGQLGSIRAFAADDIWAVGHSGLESLDFRPLVMHYDGSKWSHMPHPDVPLGYAFGIDGTPGDLWMAGTMIGTFDTFLANYEGGSWTLVDHPSPRTDYASFGAVAYAAADDVWVTGSYLNRKGVFAPVVERYDGYGWSVVPAPSLGTLGTSLQDVAITTTGRALAVGNYQRSDGTSRPFSMRWAGGGWTVIRAAEGGPSTSFGSVTAGPAGTWAVGTEAQLDGSSPQALTERLVSGRWEVVPAGQAPGDNYLLGVSQTNGGELWAVGFHRTDLEFTLVEHRC